VRTHHADPDQVSVADADRQDPEMMVAPIKVESGVRCTLKCSVVAQVLSNRRNHVRSSQWAILAYGSRLIPTRNHAVNTPKVQKW